MDQSDLPYLDLDAPGFSTRGPEVLAARKASWCARTRFGLAVLQHRAAGQLLRDRRLRQGSHAWPTAIGISGSFAEFWENSVISQEGDAHRKLRLVAAPALSADFIDSLRPSFDAIADALCQNLVAKEEVEFMGAFSSEFAGGRSVPFWQLIRDDWPQVAADASALGLAMGIEAKKHETYFNASCDRLMARASRLIQRARDQGDPHGYVGRLVERADALGTLSEDELQNLIVMSIFGGVDTTRAQLGFLVSLFIAHPAQWQLLRQNHDLAANAVEEAIRFRPTTTWSTREAVEAFEYDDVTIEKGQILHVLVHSTATDPTITKGGPLI